MTMLGRFTRKLTATLVALLCLGPAAQAQTITGSFTSDNAYSVWTGTVAAATTNIVPSTYNTLNIQIRQGETFSFAYTPACYIYIATWSDISDYQGLVGSFTGGVVIKTGDPQIQVAPSGIPKNSTNFPTLAEINTVISSGTWFAPFVGPTVTAGVTLAPFSSSYSTLFVPGLDPNAKWVWHNSGKDSRGVWTPTSVFPNFVPFIAYDHGEFLLWRIPCNDLVHKQSLTINKTVVGAGATFNFTTSGTGLSNFTLTPATNSTDTKVFNNLSPGSFSVTEAALSGYTLTSLSCTDDKDSGNVVDQGNRTVKNDLDEGENQVCTFVNTADTPPPNPTGCLQDIKGAVKCNADGTYTVTLSGSSFTGTDITLASETSGVAVTPPQQAWAPTTTWTISGATAGQTVKLIANATKTGGGTRPGTDQCCSGEITLVMPECPPDLGIAKVGEINKNNPDGPFNFTIGVRNMGRPIATATTLTFTDVVPPGLTFKTVTGTNWTCLPTPPVSGGTTLTCTYSGTFPIAAGQVLGSVEIVATGDNGPYTNCAVMGQPDSNADNDKACVTLQQDAGTFTVLKEVTNNTNGQVSTAGLTYPVSVTCGGNIAQLTLSDGLPQTVGPIPYGTTCQTQETATPTPTGTCSTGAPTWTTTYDPANGSQTITQGISAVVKVKNALNCPTGDGGDGTVWYKKEVVSKVKGYPTPALTFLSTFSCSNGTIGSVNLQSDGTAVPIDGLPIGTSCTITESAPTANACPQGMTTVWSNPAYSPSSAAIAANPGPTVTVTNTFDCSSGGSGTLSVTKVVTTKLPIILSMASFPITVTCGSTVTNLSVSSDGTPQTITNIPAPASCLVSEDTSNLPNVCPNGATATWAQPNIATSPVSIVAGQAATVTITNSVDCGSGGGNGYLRVTKTIDRGDVDIPLSQLAALVFPMTATCGNNTYPVNVSMLSPGIITGIPANASCSVTETVPASPTNGCPAGQAPAWVGSPSYSPASVTIQPGQGPVINVTNKMHCAKSGDGNHVTPPPPVCVPPQIVNPKGGCMCPNGMTLVDGQCVSSPPKCAPPMVLDPATGACVCPHGTRREGKSCVKQVVCIPPAHLNSRGTVCICPKGMTKKGNTCVEREQPRKRQQGDDVLRQMPGIIGNGVFRGGNGGGERRGGDDRGHPGGGTGGGGKGRP